MSKPRPWLLPLLTTLTLSTTIIAIGLITTPTPKDQLADTPACQPGTFEWFALYGPIGCRMTRTMAEDPLRGAIVLLAPILSLGTYWTLSKVDTGRFRRMLDDG